MAPVNSIAQAMLFSCLLIAASMWDVRKRIIPNRICILIALTGLIDFSPVNLLGAGMASLFLIAALFRSEYMGGGDIKLLAAAGSVLGIQATIVALCLSLIPILLYWPLAILVQKHKFPDKPMHCCGIPFAVVPFLSIGLIAAAIFKVGGLIV